MHATNIFTQKTGDIISDNPKIREIVTAPTFQSEDRIQQESYRVMMPDADLLEGFVKNEDYMQPIFQGHIQKAAVDEMEFKYPVPQELQDEIIKKLRVYLNGRTPVFEDIKIKLKKNLDDTQDTRI